MKGCQLIVRPRLLRHLLLITDHSFRPSSIVVTQEQSSVSGYIILIVSVKLMGVIDLKHYRCNRVGDLKSHRRYTVFSLLVIDRLIIKKLVRSTSRSSEFMITYVQRCTNADKLLAGSDTKSFCSSCIYACTGGSQALLWALPSYSYFRSPPSGMLTLNLSIFTTLKTDLHHHRSASRLARIRSGRSSVTGAWLRYVPCQTRTLSLLTPYDRP